MGCFSKPKTKVKSVSTLTPDQQTLMKSLGSLLTPYIGQTDQQINPFTPMQNQAFNLATDLPGQIGGYQEAAKQSLSGLMSGQWAQPMADWTSRLWSGTIMPSIMERAGGMDSAGSGGTIEALSQGGQDLSLALQAQLAPLMAQTQLSGIPLMGQVPQWQIPAMDVLSQFGAQQRQSQSPLQSQIWNLLPMLLGQQKENVAYQKAGGMGYSALTGGLGSFLGTEAGAGAALGGLGKIAGFLSDATVKENIVPIEGVLTKLRNLALRRYNFVGDDTKRIGLLAQEVEREFPEAVFEVDGLKRIDGYALLSILVAGLAELSER